MNAEQREKLQEMTKEQWTPTQLNVTVPIMHLRTLARRYANSHDPMDYEGLVRCAVYELSNTQAHTELLEITTP